MTGRPRRRPAASPQALRDALLVLLACGSGATDAASFERLGHVFASVMTGNLVLLGIGAARAADGGSGGRAVVLAGVALVAYGLGVLVTAPRHPAAQRPPHLLWPRATTGVLCVDLALLVAVSAGWELVDGRPGATTQTLLLAGAAAAMGARGTATRRIDGISTTYLTSTFISMLETLAARRAWSGGERRSLAILVAAVLGAAAAILLVLHAPRLVPVLLLAPPALVIAQATWLPRESRRVRSSVSR